MHKRFNQNPLPWRRDGQDVYDANDMIVAQAVNVEAAELIVFAVKLSASVIGTEGGSKTSEAKAKAARENGQLGGRPQTKGSK